MLQKTGIGVDMPRQLAYHIVVYGLCRLVLTALSTIGVACASGEHFRPGFVFTRFLLRWSSIGAAGSWFGPGILDPIVAS